MKLPLANSNKFDGLRSLKRSRLGADMLAGMTLAAVGIPEVMGYTKIIGTPVVTGLYAMLLPMLLFALFGSSRHLVVSADSATAAMVAAALTALAYAPYSPKYVALAGLVALMVAGMLLLARLFRLGFLADFLSRTVLVGFLSGVGLQVAFGELHGLLGFEKVGNGFFGQLFHVLKALPQTHWPSLSISLTVLAIIWIFEKKAPRLPGALLAVAGLIAASKVFDFGAQGIALVGTVPGGLPRVGLPEVAWHDFTRVLPIAASCFIVILAQSAATARAYALKYREAFDENTDLVGLGLANAAAGLSEPGRTPDGRGHGASGAAVPDGALGGLAECGAVGDRVPDRAEADRCPRACRDPPNEAG
jgi:SulP family sulfate permease